MTFGPSWNNQMEMHVSFAVCVLLIVFCILHVASCIFTWCILLLSFCRLHFSSCYFGQHTAKCRQQFAFRVLRFTMRSLHVAICSSHTDACIVLFCILRYGNKHTARCRSQMRFAFLRFCVAIAFCVLRFTNVHLARSNLQFAYRYLHCCILHLAFWE